MSALEHASNATFVYLWSSYHCFVRWGTILDRKLTSPMRLAVSPFDDVTTWNIRVVPRAWSSILDEIWEKTFSKQKLLINYTEACWISFPFYFPCPLLFLVDVENFLKCTRIYIKIPCKIIYGAVRHCFWSGRLFDTVFLSLKSVFSFNLNGGTVRCRKKGWCTTRQTTVYEYANWTQNYKHSSSFISRSGRCTSFI